MDIATGGVALRARIGYLDQSPQFYGWMRGRELLTFVGELFGLRGAALRSRVDDALALTGLTDAASRSVHGYSGGMRQRLGLAQALVNRPDVLLLDEPVSALDPEGRHAMLDVIAGLRGQATVLMSSHILADIERVCDTVAILNHGRLVVSSPVAELQERYAQPVFLLEIEPGPEERVAGWSPRCGRRRGRMRSPGSGPACGWWRAIRRWRAAKSWRRWSRRAWRCSALSAPGPPWRISSCGSPAAASRRKRRRADGGLWRLSAQRAA